jgi:hypothetical protein
LSDGGLATHRRTSEMVRDIRAPREVYDDERRAEADASLRSFLESYFPSAFPLEWSPDHLDVIDTLQHVASNGGLYALAMPRGSGKTSIAIRAALWALLTKRRRSVEVIASTEMAAKKLIKTLRQELSFNDQLRLDYPAELHGIWQLRGDNRRAGGQICEKQKTGVVLGVSEIVFATHQYGGIGGSTVYAAGLTGNVRGPNHTTMTGEVLRPDFVILDDPQTRESATSAAQTEERCQIVEADVLGLAGPGKSIAAVMPCTVIARDDLADRFLQNPQWHAKRAKLLPVFPKNMALWDRYYEARSEGLRVDRTPFVGDQFYQQHRAELEDGAVVGWPARKEPGEITALQSAMHLWYRSPTAFAAEYNNEPLDPRKTKDAPTFAGILAKLSRSPRRVAPLWATKVTVGIDVQQRALFWLMVAWADDFTGTIIDYGAWPQQSRTYFTLGDLNPTLQQASGSSQIEGAVRWGLDTLTAELLGRSVIRERDAGEVPVGRCVIDANWGQSTDTVYEFCRRAEHRAIVVPSHGKGIKAGDKPMGEWPKKPGESHGWNWILTDGQNQRKLRHIIHDVNHWKTTLAGRVTAAIGERGSLSLFGDKPEEHRLLADHLAAESCEETFGRSRQVWEWRARPGADNHWLDCLVMAAVGASMLGCVPPGIESTAVKQAKVFQLPAGARRG